jgi:hypothetical protein
MRTADQSRWDMTLDPTSTFLFTIRIPIATATTSIAITRTIILLATRLKLLMTTMLMRCISRL